jgi:hypothetical protein
MSKLFNIRNLTAGAFITAATLSMLSFGGSAQASANLMSCSGPTAGKVIDCCQKLTRQDRPLWMREAGSTCHDVVVCRGNHASKGKCYVRIVRNVPEQRQTPEPKSPKSNEQRPGKN